MYPIFFVHTLHVVREVLRPLTPPLGKDTPSNLLGFVPWKALRRAVGHSLSPCCETFYPFIKMSYI